MAFADRLYGRLDRLGMELEDLADAALGLLAGDEDALLRAYRRLDVSSRAALLQVATKMAPEPEVPERKARRSPSRS